MTTENTTSTAPAAEVKETIEQKVAALNAEKADLTSKLNTLPEGADKTAAAERIAVIDRKVRWYAGRSGSKTARPSKAAKAPKAPKAPKTAAAPAAPVAPVANES